MGNIFSNQSYEGNVMNIRHRGVLIIILVIAYLIISLAAMTTLYINYEYQSNEVERYKKEVQTMFEQAHRIEQDNQKLILENQETLKSNQKKLLKK